VSQAFTQEPRESTLPDATVAPKPTSAETLRAFAEGFFQGAGPALTTILNRQTTASVLTIESLTPAEVHGRAPLPWVVAKLHYALGLGGEHWLIIKKSSAIVLARALVEEAAQEQDDLFPSHEEAIREAINQIFAAACSTLTPLITRSLSTAPLSLALIEDRGSLPPELKPQGEPLWFITAQVRSSAGLQFDLWLTVSQRLAWEITSIGSHGGPGVGRLSSADGSLPSRLDLILDITLPVTVELGRARMQVQDILKLGPGSVIELEKSAGDPVELFINDRPIAKGEVVVIDENFGVRLTSIVTPIERTKT
jgi:flagellar motor switch protein FliN